MKFIELTTKYSKPILINIKDIQLIELYEHENNLTAITIRDYGEVLVKEELAEIYCDIQSLIEENQL